MLDTPIAADDGVRWIHVVGVPSIEVLERLKKTYSLDPLALEDVVNARSTPEVQRIREHLFVTLSDSDADQPGQFEQLSVFANKQIVVSFHDGTPGTCSIRSANVSRSEQEPYARATTATICCTR